MGKGRLARHVREEKATYGAVGGGIVIMEGELLDAAEQQMESLRAKAVSVSQALAAAGVPHAVIGGMAVLGHMRRVDRTAYHTTRDLDVLVNRSDLDRAAEALKPLGFRFRKVMGIPAFIPPRDAGVKSRFREGVHLIWAGEKVRPDDLAAAPSLEEAPTVLAPDGYACLDVGLLLRMKLTSFRLKDQVHVQDLLEWRLISKKIEADLPPELRERLEQVKRATERERLG